MKILILNWRDIKHPLAGGAEHVLLKHAAYWSLQGAEVLWFSSSFPSSKGAETIDSIRYFRRGSHYTTHLWAVMYYIFGKFGKIDVIVDNFHFIPYFTPLYARREKKMAFIHEVAGSVWYENIQRPFSSIGYYLERYFFKLYRSITFLTVSDSTRKELIKMSIPDKNIVILPNGVDPVSVKKSISKEKTPTILYVGRISKDKGIYDLFDAFSILVQKRMPIQLWIVGKEEKEGSIKEIINAHPKSSEHITYFGRVSENQKYELLKKTWVLIHPSKKEGWGLTIIEAATQGTPAVGYNVEGLRDSIVDGKTGILTRPTAEDLATVISNLLEDPQKIEYLGNNAKRWSEKFNWKTSVKKSWEKINA